MHAKYANRKAELRAIDFYETLPQDFRHFAFDIKKAILTLGNCTIHSYQEFAAHWDVEAGDVIAYCESRKGCTYKQGENYIIMFNDSPDIARADKTITLAHELGHILLGHLIVLESFKIFNSSHANEHFERDADHFAAVVLKKAAREKSRGARSAEIAVPAYLFERAELDWI